VVGVPVRMMNETRRATIQVVTRRGPEVIALERGVWMPDHLDPDSFAYQHASEIQDQYVARQLAERLLARGLIRVDRVDQAEST
jgi:hypothetical protein